MSNLVLEIRQLVAVAFVEEETVQDVFDILKRANFKIKTTDLVPLAFAQLF